MDKNNKHKFNEMIQKVNATKNGKVVLATLMQESGIYSEPKFDPLTNSYESVEAFLGRRSVGLFIHNALNTKLKEVQGG